MRIFPTRIGIVLLVTLCGPGFAATDFPARGEEQFVFETWGKQKIEAFKGSFAVPENRRIEDGRSIKIGYVRLPATGAVATPPIVYLAGGPGGSGIAAINYRTRMFMEMRKHGDVIALDQRGTGVSNVLPTCTSNQQAPTVERVSDRAYAAAQRAALKDCLSFWREKSVDLSAYNTLENARDLDALRVHLGAENIVLWGVSYGSHLALAALKEPDVRIAKVLISSVEGLDQTIKLPSGADRYFDRLQRAIDGQPTAKAAFPDIKALMRRVHARLERKPLLIRLKSRTDAPRDFLLHRRDMQLLSATLIADPESVVHLLSIYRALDLGETPSFDSIPRRLLPDNLSAAGEPISFDAMPVAMDIASGMTGQHRARVIREAKKALLGEYLDYTFLFDGMVPELDLGDSFRINPRSAVPVLVLSGTLDGRTVFESQREAVRGLEKATMITVANAGHNLFDRPSPEMLEIMHAFMDGDAVADSTIAVELPDFAPRNP